MTKKVTIFQFKPLDCYLGQLFLRHFGESFLIVWAVLFGQLVLKNLDLLLLVPIFSLAFGSFILNTTLVFMPLLWPFALFGAVILAGFKLLNTNEFLALRLMGFATAHFKKLFQLLALVAIMGTTILTQFIVPQAFAKYEQALTKLIFAQPAQFFKAGSVRVLPGYLVWAQSESDSLENVFIIDRSLPQMEQIFLIKQLKLRKKQLAMQNVLALITTYEGQDRALYGFKAASGIYQFQLPTSSNQSSFQKLSTPKLLKQAVKEYKMQQELQHEAEASLIKQQATWLDLYVQSTHDSSQKNYLLPFYEDLKKHQQQKVLSIYFKASFLELYERFVLPVTTLLMMMIAWQLLIICSLATKKYHYLFIYAFLILLGFWLLFYFSKLFYMLLGGALWLIFLPNLFLLALFGLLKGRAKW